MNPFAVFLLLTSDQRLESPADSESWQTQHMIPVQVGTTGAETDIRKEKPCGVKNGSKDELEKDTSLRGSRGVVLRSTLLRTYT